MGSGTWKNFRTMHDQIIADTMFPFNDLYKRIWRYLKSGRWQALDRILFRKRDTVRIGLTRVYKDAEVNTDHHLLASKLYCQSMGSTEPPKKESKNNPQAGGKKLYLKKVPAKFDLSTGNNYDGE